MLVLKYYDFNAIESGTEANSISFFQFIINDGTSRPIDIVFHLNMAYFGSC